MKLAIVAVLAVGVVGLTIGGLTMTEATQKELITVSDAICGPHPVIEGAFIVLAWMVVNNSPFSATVTTGFTQGEYTVTETNTLEPNERIYAGTSQIFSGKCPESGIMPVQIINTKFNVTENDITRIVAKITNLETKVRELETDKSDLENRLESRISGLPTLFYGTVYQNIDYERLTAERVAGVEIMVVSTADHTDVKRTTTGSEGEWVVMVEPGDYLIQAIGGGPDAYVYTTISEHDVRKMDLDYSRSDD